MPRRKKRSHALSINELENARLRAAGVEPEIIHDAERSPVRLRRWFGKSTHLSSLEKRQRGIIDDTLSHMPDPEKTGLTLADIEYLNRALYGA